MSYADCHSNKVFVILAATILLYSVTLDVIAQNDMFNPYLPESNIKISLPEFAPALKLTSPTDVGKSKIFTQLNNQKKVGLNSSVENNKNLLFSYLNENAKILSQSKISEAEPDEVAVVPSLGYFVPIPKAPAITKSQWDQVIKAKYKSSSVESVAPGIKHITMRKYSKGGSLFINIVEINQFINDKIEIRPALANNSLHGTKRISKLVKDNDALIGINASFFKPSNGVPLGTMIINQEIMTGPLFNRVVFGISDNEFKMSQMIFDGKLIKNDNSEVKIDNINQPRMLSSAVLVYSDKWGNIAPPCPKYGIQASIENGVVTQISKNQLEIPKKGYVLVGPEKQLGSLKINEPVNFKFSTSPDWSDVKHAVSGGPYLVKEGKLFIDAKEQKFGSITGLNPRTAIGYTKDNTLIMITIDGRQSKSVGINLYGLAKIMKDLGCYNAMNLDGGSSTQMIVKGRLVNYPINKGGNQVSNGLIVRLK